MKYLLSFALLTLLSTPLSAQAYYDGVSVLTQKLYPEMERILLFQTPETKGSDSKTSATGSELAFAMSGEKTGLKIRIITLEEGLSLEKVSKIVLQSFKKGYVVFLPDGDPNIRPGSRIANVILSAAVRFKAPVFATDPKWLEDNRVLAVAGEKIPTPLFNQKLVEKLGLTEAMKDILKTPPPTTTTPGGHLMTLMGDVVSGTQASISGGLFRISISFLFSYVIGFLKLYMEMFFGQSLPSQYNSFRSNKNQSTHTLKTGSTVRYFMSQTRSHTNQKGYILLWLALAVGVLVIGAAAAAPYLAREWSLQNRLKTQTTIQTAFGSIFPDPAGRNRSACAMAQFGYSPAAPTVLLRPGDKTPGWSLLFLSQQSAVGASDPSHASIPVFAGAYPAWNGPYWQGSINGNSEPVDAWGRIFQLRWVTSPSPGWIVHSPGGNGIDDTLSYSGTPAGDDIIYPNPPYIPPPPDNTVASPNFQFWFASPGNGNVLVQFTLKYTGGSQVIVGSFNNGHKDGRNWSDTFKNVPVGQWQLEIWPQYGSLRIVTVIVTKTSISPTPITFGEDG